LKPLTWIVSAVPVRVQVPRRPVVGVQPKSARVLPLNVARLMIGSPETYVESMAKYAGIVKGGKGRKKGLALRIVDLPLKSNVMIPPPIPGNEMSPVMEYAGSDEAEDVGPVQILPKAGFKAPLVQPTSWGMGEDKFKDPSVSTTRSPNDS